MEIPVANSKNYLYAEFEFSSEWTGTKTAIFNNGTAYEVILEDNKCLVPWEVITPQGFSVSVFCGDRITANKSFVQVLASGYQEGETPEPPTPTVYEQIIADLDDKQDKGDYLEPENIIAGDNVRVDRNGKNVTISSLGGGVKDYAELENKPKINSVELNGNKSLADLGVQPAGSYATSANLSGEETARQNADNNLQGQIDALVAASDVVDVVGTYADLQNYDTQHIQANDIVKVLNDSTHNNAQSYYRWVITEGVGAWVYVGSEGETYTKSETDALLQGKVNESAIKQSTGQSTTDLMSQKAVTEALSGKQNTLQAGTGITIDGNVISSSGGTVDTAMSDSSTNAVQNKVIKAYVDNKIDTEINAALADIIGGLV